MKHFNVKFYPDGKEISVHSDATLLVAAGQAGIILNTSCGGRGTCRKCLVNLLPDGQEVLACQYHIQNDLKVIIPDASRFFEHKILETGISAKIKVEPTVCKHYLKIDSADAGTLEAALKKSRSNRIYELGPEITNQLSRLDKKTLANGITVLCHLLPDELSGCKPPKCKYTVVCLEKGDTTSEIFGLAIDIGTTTVVVKLINMLDGKCLATKAELNPQIQYGDDVISRITYAETDEHLAQLQKLIVGCINKLTAKLCKALSIDSAHIYEVTIVGNTTMNHIFLKLPVKQLGQAPYNAHSVDAHDLPAGKLGLKINPAANVHTVENIAGFVGADTTAVALAVDIDSAKQMSMVVDIGTNGEIILGTKDELYAASCAAGPALEGARISQGSRAMDGAIEAVVVNKTDIGLDVIGNCTPVSICGSGMIDAVAVLLDLGIIDSTGRFVEPQKLKDKLSPKIMSRLTTQNSQPAFCLSDTSHAHQPKVLLTQKDIRQVQLAKAAIRTGIKLLQKKIGIEDMDIKCIYLAGAFGNYIRRKSAVRIGLLPDIPLERIQSVGNAAASGAQMVLLSRTVRAKAAKLARKIKYIEIAHEPDFATVYTDCMSF